MGFNTYPCSPFPPSTADMEKGDVTEQQKALIATIPGKAQKADIAPEFSTETAYNTGDLVYYNGALYEFTADHAAGAWSTDDTQAATIGGELDQLKSGLTNYENQNNLNLEVANRKNILPVSLANVKAKNTTGTWTGNTYAINSGEITFTANADGYITEIVINGTFATNTTFFKLCDSFSPFETKNYILSGVVADTEQEVTQIYFHNDTDDIDVNPRDKGQGATISLDKGKSYTCYLRVSTGTQIDNNRAYPMLRETGQNATFAPYIPSVESRIEAVESTTALKTVNVSPVAGHGITVDDGGVYRVGDLVIVQIKFTTTDATTDFFYGLPHPKQTGSTTLINLLSGDGTLFNVNTSGFLRSASRQAGTYSCTGIYVTDVS